MGESRLAKQVDKLEAKAEELQAKADDLRAKAGDKAERLSEQASSAVEDLQEKAEDMAEEDTGSKKGLLTLIIAAVAGVALYFKKKREQELDEALWEEPRAL